MIDEREEIDERDDDDNVEKSGGGWLGKIVALLLGFILGIGAIAGTVAAVAYYVMKKPMKNVVNTVDKVVDTFDPTISVYETLFDPENGFLNADYADKLVADLVRDAIAAAESVSNGGPLSDLADISPKVRYLVSLLTEKTDDYGIILDEDEILSKSTDQLLPYMEETIKQTPLGSLLLGFNGEEGLNDNILLSICYGAPARYTKKTNEDGTETFEMNQILFTYEDRDPTDEDDGKKFYDIDGREVKNATYDETKKLLTVDDTSYYLKLDESATEKETYLAYADSKLEEEVYYHATTVVDFTSDMSSAFDNINLCDVLELYNVNEGHEVLVSLAYGAKGVDYTTDENGNIEVWTYRRTIGDLKYDNKDLLDGLYLKDLLSVTPDSHKVVISLAYGPDYQINGSDITSSNPRTLGDFTHNSKEIINEIHLSDVMTPDTTSALSMYLLYGREGVHYVLDGTTPVMQDKKIAIYANTETNVYKAYNEYGEPLSGSVNFVLEQYVDEEGNVFKFVDLPADDNLVKTVKTEDGIATLYYLCNADGTSVGKYDSTTLGTFSGEDGAEDPIAKLTSRLTIGEIMGEENLADNIFLSRVSNETIETLPKAINNLAFTDVYEDKIYDTDGDGTYTDEEKANKEPNRPWWYMLHNDDSCHINHCHNGDSEACPGDTCTLTTPSCGRDCLEPYTIEDFGELMTNMTHNIENSTLNDLKNDKMIDLDDTTLGTKLVSEIRLTDTVAIDIGGVPEGKEYLGELTVHEMLIYTGKVLTAINDIPDKIQELLNPTIPPTP